MLQLVCRLAIRTDGRLTLIPLLIALLAGGCTSTPTTPMEVEAEPIAALQTLSVDPASVPAGSTAQGIVTLTTAAPPAGVVVTVSLGDAASAGAPAANPAAPAVTAGDAAKADEIPPASAPASITIPGGATSGTFHIQTSAAPPGTSSRQITLTAAARGQTRRAVLTITTPDLALDSLAIDPMSFRGTTDTHGTITLNGPAPDGGMTVTLTSDNHDARVPATVVIPAGDTAATFTVTTDSVSEDTFVRISATAGGVTRTVDITLLPAPPRQSDPTPAPTLAAVSPSTGTQGSVVNVTLTGTHFVASGIAVKVSGGGVIVGNISGVTGSVLTATFTIDASAAPGGRSVTVTTAGGTSGARPFTVQAGATAVDDAVTTAEDAGPAVIDVLSNDAGIGLQIVGAGTPDGSGTVSVASGGLGLIYEPANDFFGDERFTYTVKATGGQTDTASVTMTVEPRNDAPTPLLNEVTMDEDTTFVADLTAGDIDTDEADLTYTITRLPVVTSQTGAVLHVAQGDGTPGAAIATVPFTVPRGAGGAPLIVVVPVNNWFTRQPDDSTFEYQVTDKDAHLSSGDTGYATHTVGVNVIVNIKPVNDAPSLRPR